MPVTDCQAVHNTHTFAFALQMGMACAYEINKSDAGKTAIAMVRPDSPDYKSNVAPSAGNDFADAQADTTCDVVQQGATRECTDGSSPELRPRPASADDIDTNRPVAAQTLSLDSPERLDSTDSIDPLEPPDLTCHNADGCITGSAPHDG